ncbi:MAG TPA: CDP-alcohol phosphatidyltransferase family protein [Spirochaetota bacterium]|nr:CDP-alcohol phosphatidyltransferase family protein [Spirochaetota bacterium]HOM38993.1 CDP-alcohol phosphatidyltransferase family protein [Spirochaetota bacterium]HPQ48348.1 CDP-alcohol phosphatidyltransferase family protein [Spirochaetota bacterium]
MKVLIFLPHKFYLKKIAGITFLKRIVNELIKAKIYDIFVLSNLIPNDNNSNSVIKIVKKKSDIKEVLGEKYILIDLPAVFDHEFIQDFIRKNPEDIKSFSSVIQGNYKGIFIPIYTEKEIKKAEKALIKSLRKPHDTLISKYLNRPISLFVSSLLMNTKITPNMITIFVVIIGLLASFIMVLKPDYYGGLIGGILFHLSSVLDGCDGEIARLKYQTSKIGVWLDNIGDELTNFVFIGAVGIYNSTYYKNEIFFKTSLLFMLIFLVSKIMQYFLIIKGYKKEDIAQFDIETEKIKKGLIKKIVNFFVSIAKVVARNDFFALSMMIAGITSLFNIAQIIIGLVVTGLFIGVVIEFIKIIFGAKNEKN